MKVDMNDMIPIHLLHEIQIDCFITTGFHVYKDTWQPFIGEKVPAFMEPQNPVDQYAVCVKKVGHIIGQIEKGWSGS